MRTSESYPSDAQIRYICDMLDGKELTHDERFGQAMQAAGQSQAEYIQFLKDQVNSGRVNRQRAGAIIVSLKALPWKRKVDVEARTDEPRPATRADYLMRWHVGYEDFGAKDDAEDLTRYYFMSRSNVLRVPRGSYAVPTRLLMGDRTNETNFYSVWISDNGEKWTVRQYISNERVKMPRAEQYRILDIIGVDPGAYAKLYGLKIGKCGICGRKLTNDKSRELGIGPVCASRWGW
jgi:hypothetical protein